MMDPQSVTWRRGFNESRPARFAVSSPKASATSPWEISCRITDGTRMQKRMTSVDVMRWLRTRIATTATAATSHSVVRWGDLWAGPRGGRVARPRGGGPWPYGGFPHGGCPFGPSGPFGAGAFAQPVPPVVPGAFGSAGGRHGVRHACWRCGAVP